MHFTTRAGWTNDPHGLVHVDGVYHLFFQYNPASTNWSPACHWGHATSTDLLHWTEQPVALTPDDEVGCWSGSLVLDGATPTILYTRVEGDDWGHGLIALARGSRDLRTWRREPREAVAASPEQLDVRAFRDPYVWPVDDGWRMVVGAGTTAGTALAVQYSSPDLESWRYDGVLASRNDAEQDPVWTGKLWECPQLFELDGTWVLLASIWDDDVLHHEFYALGDYDGKMFAPRSWGRFSFGDQLYAATTFIDADGRRCLMAWVREQGNKAPVGSPFAGAMSLPMVLRVDGDRLLADPHPNLALAARRQSPLAFGDGTVASTRLPTSAVLELRYGALSGGVVILDVGPDGDPGAADGSFRVRADSALWELTVESGATRLLTMPLPYDGAGTEVLTLVVDADIVEVFAAGRAGVGAVRVPVAPAAVRRVRVSASGVRGQLTAATIS